MVDKATLKANGCCTQPDRHEPKLLCGYPLPCPHHTVVIDTTGITATITTPVTANLPIVGELRLRQVAASLDGLPMQPATQKQKVRSSHRPKCKSRRRKP